MESILKYKILISELPVLKQKSAAQRRIWVKDNSDAGILSKEHSFLIKDLINSAEMIEISRKNIFDETNITKKIIGIFIWGYPTGGRGKNIEYCFKQINALESMCKFISNKNLKLEEYYEVIKEFKSIKGLGASTWTKFMYFFETKIEGIPTVIFDSQIEKSLKQAQFKEFHNLKDLKHENERHFINYIDRVDKVSRQLDVRADKIELFLFYFNLNYMFLNKGGNQ